MPAKADILSCFFIILFSCFLRNAANVFENCGRAVTVGFRGFFGGSTGKNKNGFHAGFKTGNNVGVHSVADHNRFVGMAVKKAKTGSHHKGVWFSAEISLFAGGNFNRCNKSAAGRHNSVFNGSGNIGVRSDKLCAVSYKVRRFGNGIERIGFSFAYYNVIRVDVVHGDSRIIKSVEKGRFANGINAAAGSLFFKKSGGSESACVKMVFGNIKSHSGKFLLKLTGSVAAVVGKEKEFFVFGMKPVDKFADAGNNLVSAIDNSIHIADEAFDFVKIDHI